MSHFTIKHVRPLGEGGLGTVDEVEIIGGNAYPLGTRFARKQLGAQWANDPGAQGRFEREIELLRTMNHPAIVQFKGQHVPGNVRYYLMPLYPRSLRKLLIDHNAPIALGWVVELGIKVASALQHAHESNFIHRDLKPENILMDAQNEPVVADWGLGQFVHLHSKVLDLKTNGFLGTSYYCPMEQWTKGRCEASGDVYSLGLMLTEMVRGDRLEISPPFSGIRQDVLTNATVSAMNFNATIKKMTQMYASNRHQSMNEVIFDLNNCR